MLIRKQPKSTRKQYERAKKRALARKPFLQSDGKYLSRDEVHDRGQSRGEK
jgi:hypothetical protein